MNVPAKDCERILAEVDDWIEEAGERIIFLLRRERALTARMEALEARIIDLDQAAERIAAKVVERLWGRKQ